MYEKIKQKIIQAISKIEINDISAKYNLEIEIGDIFVEVKFIIKGYFHVQKQTYEDPPFSDLYDIWLDIIKVSVYKKNYHKEFSVNEIKELEKEIIKNIKRG